MSLFNLLLAIIVLSWCDSIKGFSAAVPSARHGNTLIMGGGGGSPDGGIGTAGGGSSGGGGGALIPGSVSYQPHDSEEIERAVYDPGDELLRALNAEAAAEAAAVSSRAGGIGGGVDSSDDYIDNVINDLAMPEKFELLRKLEEDIREEQDIVSKSAMLMKLLEDPTIDTLPVVYIEENPGDDSSNLYPMSSGGGMDKRSRYYRRYPWKRHSRNRGSTYEPEIRYACTPSKEDVFKLLVGLHENRKGNHHKTVNFCNRKRPAKAIFTNIRFLG